MIRDSKQRYIQLLDFLLAQKRVLLDTGLAYDLTLAQAITLLLLEKPQPMHFVATRISCDASNVTGIVDSLERKNLVQRIDSPADRRIRLLKLQPKGTQLRKLLLGELSRNLDSLLNNLVDTEQEEFFQLLKNIAS
ncbi:MAG TPA: MarR family transcriptional regulator [Candidatus Saccharimonadales bacterium]|nr:MarR family transcriptional regulator [Candidatus Saccharimonadales bacterium]